MRSSTFWHTRSVDTSARRLPAVEPTALAALALLAAGRGGQATPALDWLAAAQSADGSLGIDAGTRHPCWPTGWAILAWNSGAKKTPAAKAEWSAAAGRAAGWLLTVRGRPIGPSDTMEEGRLVYGHDTTLQGWPWVEGTHSWVEPTAISLLALRSAGRAGHPHCREAVKLLLDRQLPDGWLELRQHDGVRAHAPPQVQPTGLALARWQAKRTSAPRCKVRSICCRTALSRRTTAASLGYALMGLAGHGLWPPQADDWLRSASERTLGHDGSPYHVALLILAAKRRIY